MYLEARRPCRVPSREENIRFNRQQGLVETWTEVQGWTTAPHGPEGIPSHRALGRRGQMRPGSGLQPGLTTLWLMSNNIHLFFRSFLLCVPGTDPLAFLRLDFCICFVELMASALQNRGGELNVAYEMLSMVP